MMRIHAKQGTVGAAIGTAVIVCAGALFQQAPVKIHAVPVVHSSESDPSGIGLYPEHTVPTEVKHFGLSPDRGLPISSMPIGRGQFIVGAPPKAWRTAFVLNDTNMVFSNHFPTWLPTKLYGNTWYHLDDWRAYVWASSGDSAGMRVEITNGLEFLECTADGAPAGQTFTCPEEAGVKVEIQGVQLWVTYPNGTRNVFERENQVDPATTGRYALMLVRRLKEGGGGSYESTKIYTRDVVTPQGKVVASTGPNGGRVRAPEYMIGMITNYDSVPGPGGVAVRPIARTIFQWKDANAETKDCKTDSNATQCSNSYKCYDRICDTARPITKAQECREWRCSWTYSVSSMFSSAAAIQECKDLLCGGDDTCWSDHVCDQQPPGGDWKLARIIMPGTMHPDTGRSLIWSFYYSGQQTPESKFLRLVEDNRGPFGAQVGVEGNILFANKRPSPGNAIQFGYDKLKTRTLQLKMVSFEKGTDSETARFEYSNDGIFQKVWTTHTNPTKFTYDWISSDATSATTVTITAPQGMETKKTFSAIGKRAPTNPPSCAPSDGCNVQLGITKLEPATGGSIESTYGGAANAQAAGMLLTTTDVDGTVMTYERDEAKYGRVKSFTAGCQKETYEYAATEFPTTPTTVTRFVGDAKIETEERTLCRPGGSCPTYELGHVVKRSTTKTGGTTITEETTFDTAAGSSKTVRSETGGGAPVTETVAALTGREPMFGRPYGVATPGTETTASESIASSDGTTETNQDCNAQTSFCGGSKDITENRTVKRKVYFPEGATGSVATALAAIGVTAPNGKREISRTVTNVGGQPQETSQTAADVAETTRTDYETWTGNVLGRHVTGNGVTLDTAYTWARAQYANSAGVQTKDHPTALASAKESVTVGGNPLYLGGEWNGYDDDTTGEPTNSHLGPIKHGHVRSDGTTSLPDWEVLERTSRGRTRVIGCPFYAPPGGGGNTCFDDYSCLCGGRCANACQGCLGVCVGSRVDPNLVCRRTYIQDPNFTVERFADSYSTTHNTDWFKQQCVQPPCLSGFSGCDNPRN
ncbi:MAG: hypothetical protein U0169_07165 [Polyangiaceae bacterium]